MIKKCFCVLSFLTILLFSCKKQEVPNAKFTFTANLQSTNSVMLKWSAVNLVEFKNITIYRSTSPIPDPTFQTPIDGNLIVGIITDKTVTNFADSNFNIGSNGTVYYKLVVNLSNRFMVSEQEQISFNAFSLVLPNSSQFSSNNFATTYLSGRNSLYIVNYSQGTINLVDYTQKKIMATTNFATNNSFGVVYATIDNGSPELFVVINNSQIACYDGVTLNQKYVVYVSNSIIDFKVKNGFLYVISSNGYFQTYNLSTQSSINQFYVPNNGYNSLSNYGIFISDYTNQLYAKFSGESSVYQQNTGTYIYTYKNILQSYNLVNGVPANANNVHISALNFDTTNYNNNNNGISSHLSSDGKYLACNQNGDVYSFVDNSTHNIRSVNNFNPYPIFSDEGKYLLSKSNNSSSSFLLMDVFALPGFNLVTSLRSLNTNTAQFVAANDFIDNDSLVSYNVSQNFTSGQALSTLTVFFKKLD